MAFTPDGRLLVADASRVWLVDEAQGITARLAGNGASGDCGDLGPALDACLTPSGVAADAAGNVLIADSEANRIRRVDAVTGIITTVAGTGSPLYCGDGGPAAAACLSAPLDVAVDSDGNLYVADLGNRRVRRVDGVTGLISTVVGTGATGFCGDGDLAPFACLTPAAIDVDALDDLFVVDFDNSRIRRVEHASGVIQTVAGSGQDGFCGDGGPATDACLLRPQAVAVSRRGDILIADTSNSRVRRVACGDTDHDGLCDLYDLSDVPGLTLASVLIRESGDGLSAHLRGTLSVAAYLPSPEAFLGDARGLGFGTRIYAGPAAPSIVDAPLLATGTGAVDCRFGVPVPGVRQTISCRKKGPRAFTLQLRATRDGGFTIRASMRGPDATLPPDGPLFVTLDGNSPLTFADALGAPGGPGVCSRASGGLRCTRVP
jgi:sugar lactone lactonase YvrE